MLTDIWSESAVRNILHQRAYAGRWIDGHGKTVVTCESVIDADVFERANQALSTREHRGPQAKNKPLLAKLKCARCGSPMYRIHGTGRSRYYFYYRCFGTKKTGLRKGCGNMVKYERLEKMVAVRVLAWNDEPHQIREWVPGKNWDSEIADTVQSIRELDPLEAADEARRPDLMEQLKEYQRLNEEESTDGTWDAVDVLNDDGSVMTRGQYFYDLYQPYLDGGDVDAAREYLKTFDIQAERAECCHGIRVLINDREDVAHEEDCENALALLGS